ncbi:unnamed protein product [Arabis nemorensis]|uniref:Uncharacterized protein n=1 Tax=Arabis nemorensis TaxID=586526 RepID=A0A565C4X7_9BRAS|nr:unnamed protein product [Arabis nemorensis]
MGCADIARKISRAIHLAPNAVIAAVASRSFATANGYPESTKIHGSYESILSMFLYPLASTSSRLYAPPRKGNTYFWRNPSP